MASEERTPGDRLTEALALVTPSHGRSRFFPLVGYLERMMGQRVRIGDEGPYAHEPIRFRHDPKLVFSSVDVSQVREVASQGDAWDDEARPKIEVTGTFLGLAGAVSPLPSYMAEEVLFDDADPPALREFLDLFHHRLLSLLYRVVVRLDHAADYVTGGGDAWSKRILALAGIDGFATAGIGAQTLGASSELVLRLAPLLASQARSATALELALREAFRDEIPRDAMRVRGFLGSWGEVDTRERIALGQRNNLLGRSMTLGTRAYDRAGKFRIEVGPVGADLYARFRKGGDLYARTRAVVGLASPGNLAWDLEIAFGAGERPGLKLGRETGSSLGRESWLRGREQAETRVVVSNEAAG